MKLFCLIILSGLLLCTLAEHTSVEIEPPKLTFSPLLTFLGKILLDVFKLAIDCFNSPRVPNGSGSFTNIEAKVYGELKTISSQIKDLEYTVKKTAEDTIIKLLEAFPKIVKLELKMHELKLIIDQINFADEQMRNYIALGNNKTKSNENTNSKANKTANISDDTDTQTTTRPSTTTTTITTTATAATTTTTETIMGSYTNTTGVTDINTRIERYTLENFAKWATDHSFNSIMSLLRRLNDLIVTKKDDSLFNLILEVSKDTHHNICTLKQSLHQTLYNLYNEIAITAFKGNVILQYSYMILHMYTKGKFSDEANLAIKNYQRQAKQQSEIIRVALSTADRTLYKCDPKEYEDGNTYTKLTGLLRGYVENEINLNSGHKCWKTCGDYKNTEQYGCRGRNKLCSHQPACSGKILNCRSVSRKMEVCLSSNPDRRYDWIKNGDETWGRGKCTRELYNANSWSTWFFYRCSYCVCFCDDIGPHSDRYFNLREVTSDLDQNKVVAGLRIVKKNRIIHIQIQQGVLAPNGLINLTSLSWKPIDNYEINQYNVRNNVDYYTMNLAERIIDTNEMVGPTDHVVTGVRFRVTGTHLNLEARVTPINFTSGELYNGRSFWLGNYRNGVNEKHGISEIELIKPDVPTRRGPHTLISQFNEYVKFQPTNLEYDMGQSTVPYFDSQILTTHGYPISGIGLIHRGEQHSGGFIAPKIISFDFSPHFVKLKTN